MREIDSLTLLAIVVLLLICGVGAHRLINRPKPAIQRMCVGKAIIVYSQDYPEYFPFSTDKASPPAADPTGADREKSPSDGGAP